MIDKLSDLLLAVRNEAGEEFSGIGLIIHQENSDNLPIFPLRLANPRIDNADVVRTLAHISKRSSNYHDGFHLISIDWKITHVAQYFSPPITPGAQVERTRPFGGRYLAALFGSSLPNITLTGIASNGFGIAVFQNGKEVFFKDLLC